MRAKEMIIIIKVIKPCHFGSLSSAVLLSVVMVVVVVVIIIVSSSQQCCCSVFVATILLSLWGFSYPISSVVGIRNADAPQHATRNLIFLATPSLLLSAEKTTEESIDCSVLSLAGCHSLICSRG